MWDTSDEWLRFVVNGCIVAGLSLVVLLCLLDSVVVGPPRHGWIHYTLCGLLGVSVAMWSWGSAFWLGTSGSDESRTASRSAIVDTTTTTVIVDMLEGALFSPWRLRWAALLEWRGDWILEEWLLCSCSTTLFIVVEGRRCGSKFVWCRLLTLWFVSLPIAVLGALLCMVHAPPVVVQSEYTKGRLPVAWLLLCVLLLVAYTIPGGTPLHVPLWFGTVTCMLSLLAPPGDVTTSPSDSEGAEEPTEKAYDIPGHAVLTILYGMLGGASLLLTGVTQRLLHISSNAAAKEAESAYCSHGPKPQCLDLVLVVVAMSCALVHSRLDEQRGPSAFDVLRLMVLPPISQREPRVWVWLLRRVIMLAVASFMIGPTFACASLLSIREMWLACAWQPEQEAFAVAPMAANPFRRRRRSSGEAEDRTDFRPLDPTKFLHDHMPDPLTPPDDDEQREVNSSPTFFQAKEARGRRRSSDDSSSPTFAAVPSHVAGVNRRRLSSSLL